MIDIPSGDAIYSLPSLPISLENAGTWGNYGGYAFDFIDNIKGRREFSSDQFKADASRGNLPSVSWVYAPHEFSEHPRGYRDTDPRVGNVTLGMQWTVDQVNAIVDGGLWSKSAIFITWDDWGGWYDHVAPPSVQTWVDGTQFRYGYRVACLVLSPYARKGISNILHSHIILTNIISSIQIHVLLLLRRLCSCTRLG